MLRRLSVDDILASEARERAFQPPCCPLAECASNGGAAAFRCVRNGWHERQRAPFRVQRFRCRVCKGTFSSQTFRESYWKKRPDLDRLIFMAARGCAGNRQIATQLACGKSTVAEKIARLSRHAVRFHVRAVSAAARLNGDVLFDGLGTFEHSQFHPYWLNVSVHRPTSLVLGFSESPLRRSGTMKPWQKRKRTELEELHGRPDPSAVRTGTADLLRAIKPFLDLDAVRFVSDEHKRYPEALRDAGLDELPHLRISGSAQRTAANPLFEINLADMLLRHGQSSQKRETIAFNKRRQAGLERAWLWATWRNFMAPQRVKRRNAPPAVLAGIASRALSWNDIFEERILPWTVELPEVWERHVRREVLTARIPNNRTNDARHVR